MKKLMIVIFIATSLNGGILDVAPNTLFTSAKTFKDSGIGFELVNKSKRPIWIALRTGGDTTRVAKVEPASTMATHQVRYSFKNLDQKVQLAVWYSDPGHVTFEAKYGGLVGKEIFKPAPNKVISFPAGKTLYVNWDESNYVRPQRGPLKGKLKKTDTNLSLAQNVAQEDIIEQPAMAAA